MTASKLYRRKGQKIGEKGGKIERQNAQVSSCPHFAELVILLKTVTCAKAACLNVHEKRRRQFV